MKRIKALPALGLSVYLAGCGGANFYSSKATSPVPKSQIVYTVAESATTDALMSCDLDGAHPTFHASLPLSLEVHDVDASGTKLLAVADNADGVTVDVQLTDLTGKLVSQITNLQFDDIVSVRYSRDFSKIVISGTFNGGTPAIVTANADGSNQQTILDTAEIATLTASNMLAVGGLTNSTVPVPFVGLMSIDGLTVTKLVTNVQPIEIDEFGGKIAYSASIGGDASGTTAISVVSAAGGSPTSLYPVTSGIDAYPRFTSDGSSVVFVHDGIGLFSVSAAGGTPKKLLSDVNVQNILSIR